MYFLCYIEQIPFKIFHAHVFGLCTGFMLQERLMGLDVERLLGVRARRSELL